VSPPPIELAAGAGLVLVPIGLLGGGPPQHAAALLVAGALCAVGSTLAALLQAERGRPPRRGPPSAR
jgi:hypothetical protein